MTKLKRIEGKDKKVKFIGKFAFETIVLDKMKDLNSEVLNLVITIDELEKRIIEIKKYLASSKIYNLCESELFGDRFGTKKPEPLLKAYQEMKNQELYDFFDKLKQVYLPFLEKFNTVERYCIEKEYVGAK